MQSTILELIRRTTSDLPQDVVGALATAASQAGNSNAGRILTAINTNIDLARANSTPICQDTGTLTLFWRIPRGTSTAALHQAAAEAVREATSHGWLRQNTIETLSGRSLADNVALDTPGSYFEEWQRSETELWLLQKGGGCENVSTQYALPLTGQEYGFTAGRDLEGVRRVALHAVHQAQGYGCAPGILGICVGGDRALGYKIAKEQLLRPLSDHAAEPELAALEAQILQEANTLGIGPMGMGGMTTLLGVKLTTRARLPASWFVTIAYMCWACRRRGVRIATDGGLTWLG